MNHFKFNYYIAFLLIFRIAVIVQSLYFLFKGEYPPAVYCIFTLFITFIVDIVYKFTKLNPSTFMKFTVQFFIFISMFLGHTHNMYHHIPNYDDILHIFSGFIIAFLGYLILDTFNLGRNNPKYKCFVSLFIFIFSLALAGLWEVYEFTTDYFFSLNSQGGSLNDTMLDIINGSIGPIIISIVHLFKPNIFNRN